MNGAAIRTAMRQGTEHGARLVQLSEGALSGYVGPAKQYYTGWRIDWAPVTDELHVTMALAAELGVWVVAGGSSPVDMQPRTVFWVSIAVPAQCAPAGRSAVVGPHGNVLKHARSEGPEVICVDLDRTDPALDLALNKARPWREAARAGHIYASRRVSDPRSTNRASI